jgi:uncharacterized membrane protein
MPKRALSSLMIAGIFIVIAVAALVYGITVNHIVYSTNDAVYVMPVFGILIDRGTLYDTTIIVIVGAVVALIFLAFWLLDSCKASDQGSCRTRISSDAGWNRKNAGD